MRIGALVPIRLASERLPGKQLKNIAGRPAVLHLLERLFASRYLAPDRVVVCTTQDPSDDALVPVVESSGARVFRGSRDDIVDRFHRATEHHGFDAVLQADGDDPFTDTAYMDFCMDQLLADDGLDICCCKGLPLGLNAKAIRARAIRRVRKHRVTEKNDHGFILLFTETGLCTTSTIHPITPAHQHATARITLDYPDDLVFFNELHAAASRLNPKFTVAEIVAALRANPALVGINAHLNSVYQQRTEDLLDLRYRRDCKILSLGVDDSRRFVDLRDTLTPAGAARRARKRPRTGARRRRESPRV
jgi:spore coat polysaccharide biosynthesis protein SpsF